MKYLPFRYLIPSLPHHILLLPSYTGRNRWNISLSGTQYPLFHTISSSSPHTLVEKDEISPFQVLSTDATEHIKWVEICNRRRIQPGLKDSACHSFVYQYKFLLNLNLDTKYKSISHWRNYGWRGSGCPPPLKKKIPFPLRKVHKSTYIFSYVCRNPNSIRRWEKN